MHLYAIAVSCPVCEYAKVLENIKLHVDLAMIFGLLNLPTYVQWETVTRLSMCTERMRLELWSQAAHIKARDLT